MVVAPSGLAYFTTFIYALKPTFFCDCPQRSIVEASSQSCSSVLAAALFPSALRNYRTADAVRLPTLARLRLDIALESLPHDTSDNSGLGRGVSSGLEAA